MPEDVKKIMAVKNANKIIKMQYFFIALCVILSLFSLIVGKNNLQKYSLNFLYYVSVIVTGLISILLCFFVKKHSDYKAETQMLPTYFTAAYLYLMMDYLFYCGHSELNSFIIFATISVVTPLYLDIEPLIFFILEIGSAIGISYKTMPVVGIVPTVDIYIFAVLTSFIAFYKWKISKSSYLNRKTQKEYTEKMEKEISLASLVQSSFFKHEENIYEDWTIGYYTKAMSGVSGDFIDIYNNNNKLEGIGIFDVSGHGIASGLVTMLVKNIITHEFQRGKADKLKTVVDRINVRYLNEKGNIENYLTGILCRIKGNTIDFVNAGHSMPILYKSNSECCTEIITENAEKAYGAIGLIGMPNNFVQHTVTMEAGDELILFTDGITDTTNETRESFGRERLIKSINRNADRPLTTQINCIVSDVTNYAHGRPLEDDITMIILKKK